MTALVTYLVTFLPTLPMSIFEVLLLSGAVAFCAAYAARPMVIVATVLAAVTQLLLVLELRADGAIIFTGLVGTWGLMALGFVVLSRRYNRQRPVRVPSTPADILP